MPSGATIAQTVAACVAAATGVAAGVKYTGTWAYFIRKTTRAVETGAEEDLEAGAGAATAVGQSAGVALQHMERRFSGEQARRAGDMRRRASM